MGTTCRAAIIGTGRMGGLIEDEIPAGSFSRPYGHFSAYAAVDEVEVVAVANRGAERLNRFVKRFGVINHPHTRPGGDDGGDPVPEWVEGRFEEPDDPGGPPTRQYRGCSRKTGSVQARVMRRRMPPRRSSTRSPIALPEGIPCTAQRFI